MAQVASDELGFGLANFTLAGEKHENVSVGVEGRNVRDRIRDGDGKLVVLGRRLVEHLDRVRATFHLDDGCPSEERREPIGLEGRGAHDHLQVRPLRKDPGQVAEEKVDGQASLVSLVDDDRVVLAKERIALNFG